MSWRASGARWVAAGEDRPKRSAQVITLRTGFECGLALGLSDTQVLPTAVTIQAHGRVRGGEQDVR